MSFAVMEHIVQNLAGFLIGRDQEIGAIVTAELSFRSLRGLTLSLYRHQHGEDAIFDSLKSLMKRAETLETHRNQIMHSVWTKAEDDETISRMKITAKEKQGYRLVSEKVTEEELRQLADDLMELQRDVSAMWIALDPSIVKIASRET